MSAPSRRQLLAGLGAVALTACTPARYAVHRGLGRPSPDDDAVLRAFVTAVVPLARPDDPDLVRVLHDPDYPFAPHASFFALELRRRSRRQHATEAFEDLSVAQRIRLVEGALAEGGLTERLFAGAIFLAQLAFYAGIYDADRGCPAIDFPGRPTGRDLVAGATPARRPFPAASLTDDGNPT